MTTQTTLGEVADLQVGFAFKSDEFSDNPSHTRLLRGDNIAQGSIRWQNAVRWPENDVDPRYELHEGDVVLAMDRPWIEAGLKFATVAVHDLPCYLVQRVARLRARPGTHQRYLHYVIAGSEFTWYVRAEQTGTAVPHISGSQIFAFPITPHSLAEQQAIADVLGALDDKIAANDRVSHTAVELADAEFSRAVRPVALGEETFEDVAQVGGGGTPKTSVAEYWGGHVPWVTPTDVTALSAPYLRSTSRSITESGLAACSSSLYPARSILMTSRATIGAFAIAEVPVAVNQGFIVVNAKDAALQWWLFHEMRSRVQEFLSHSNGATFLELSRGRFKRLNVRQPTDVVAARFAERVRPLHEMASHAVEESRRLAETRDELLPLLMSGKVRVKDAEKVVEEVT